MTDSPAKASILVVDDEEYLRGIVARRLSRDGYDCECAGGGAEAVEAMKRRDFSLVVSDINMPDMSGIDLLREIRSSHPRTGVIMLTGVDDRTTAGEAIEIGAYGYILKPFETSELLINVANALRRRELEMQRDRYEEQLEEAVRQRTKELQVAQDVTIHGLAVLAEYRDNETGGHIMRTQHYVGILAETLAAHPRFRSRLDSATVGLFAKSTPLHDIGKVGIPDAILQKPGRLTPEEFEIMKRHTIYGRDAIARAESMLGAEADNSFLRVAREITVSHHEKWDGSGYPFGLAGEDIPLVGRIMAVIDVYDALISRRVYKPPFTHRRAMDIITEGDGRVMPGHFDPHVLEVFVARQEDIRRIALDYVDSDEERTALAATT
jgi:putative two-component system response regulator